MIHVNLCDCLKAGENIPRRAIHVNASGTMGLLADSARSRLDRFLSVARGTSRIRSIPSVREFVMHIPREQGPPSAATMLALVCVLYVVAAAALVSIVGPRGPTVGAIVKVGSRSIGTEASLEVSARLPGGGTCIVGVGKRADMGGILIVVGTGPGDVVQATWAGTGRSASTGADCRNGTRITMRVVDMALITDAVAGIGAPWPGDPD